MRTLASIVLLGVGEGSEVGVRRAVLSLGLSVGLRTESGGESFFIFFYIHVLCLCCGRILKNLKFYFILFFVLYIRRVAARVIVNIINNK